MSRARLASLLTLLWSAIQAWSLVLLGFYPAFHIVGWGLCAIFLTIAIGLWFAKPWARVSFLVLGSGFVIFYIAAYYLARLPCASDSSSCNIPLVLSQPMLTIATLAILLRPLASNPTMERDARKSGARPSL
jgi:uncharacterized membrane protein